MKVKLKSYNNLQNYQCDYPENVALMLSVTKALEYAKKQISAIRGTKNFLAYKIVTLEGELLYKLPCN
ncbi:hypothetical protein JoomaDRAFT_1785 [Galbibacter orientalis DSM 19592]|uniref:Uncharacterized protein n=1 Tax=Galbibacter orientalis DSM 19592 TaxID=926559 RepID=I3C599_9FLAO|nr:hypothetical protein [Galbibacter orientalis]EIJ38792.1 hypothetical protein JoomaDRAFT_1785 [Galbibacter orientalis DSM 19592]